MSPATSTVRRRVAKVAGKVFPDHWSFLLGELALYSFLVLLGTGLVLAFWYDASGEEVVYRGSYAPLHGVTVTRSFASVMDISFERYAGMLIRQTHHWAAILFTGAITVHAMRIFFTGAFRPPRRLNYLIGVTMLTLALGNGFLGLSLPDDLLSGVTARIGYTFALSVPGFGPGLASLLFAGEFPNPEMLNRLYWLHVLVVPAAIVTLLGGHLTLVFRQTHTMTPKPGRREDEVRGDRAWPVYLTKTLSVLALVVATLVLLGGLVQINPVWLYGPYDAAWATVPAQPDIYLQWVEGALRIVPAVRFEVLGATITQPFLVGVVFPGVLFGALYAWPFLEARLTGDHRDHHLLDRPRDRPVRTAAGVGALALLVVLVGAASHDVQARLLRVPLSAITDAYRLAALAVPPAAAALAWRVCHRLRQADGTEVSPPPPEDVVPVAPVAPRGDGVGTVLGRAFGGLAAGAAVVDVWRRRGGGGRGS